MSILPYYACDRMWGGVTSCLGLEITLSKSQKHLSKVCHQSVFCNFGVWIKSIIKKKQKHCGAANNEFPLTGMTELPSRFLIGSTSCLLTSSLLMWLPGDQPAFPDSPPPMTHKATPSLSRVRQEARPYGQWPHCRKRVEGVYTVCGCAEL